MLGSEFLSLFGHRTIAESGCCRWAPGLKRSVPPMLPAAKFQEFEKRLSELNELLCDPDSSFHEARTTVLVKIQLPAAAMAALSDGVFRKSDL